MCARRSSLWVVWVLHPPEGPTGIILLQVGSEVAGVSPATCAGLGWQTDRQTSPVGAQLRAGCLCWVLLSCAGARVLPSGESKPAPSLPLHAASNHFSSVL